MSAFCVVLYSSCSKDECKDVVCQNGGTCNETDGSCTCATGYEGTNCETESRKKFIKTWAALDKETASGTTLPTYSSAVIAGTGVTEIRISKFSDAFFVNDVIATVAGNVASIASQEPDADGYYVTTGTGTLDATTGKINWTYTLKDPSGVEKSYTGEWQ